MTTVMDPAAPQVDRQTALQSRVVLLSPSCGWWKGQYQLPSSTEVKVADRKVEKKQVTKPRSILMTDTYPVDSNGVAWKKRFTEITNKADRLVETYSIPFASLRGVRIVPRAQAGMLFERMFGKDMDTVERLLDEGEFPASRAERVRATLRDFEQHYTVTSRTPAPPTERDEMPSLAHLFFLAQEDFCNNWSAICEQIKASTDTAIWNAIRDKVPSSSSIRDKFHFDITPIELAGNMERPVEIGSTELEAYSSVVRDACQRKVEEAIELMIARPREELAAALANLQTLIARDGRVTVATFDGVKRAIERVRSFDFVANETILHQMTALEGLLDNTRAASLTSQTAAQNGFSAALNNYVEEVTNEQARTQEIESFGRNFRGLDLSD